MLKHIFPLQFLSSWSKLGEMKLFKFLVFLMLVTGSVALFGQEMEPVTAGRPPALVSELAVLAGLSILPFAVMLLTSYLKIVVVLSLLRNALGVQQSPPNHVLNGIALLMTIYVMFPTGLAMYKAASGAIKQIRLKSYLQELRLLT